MPKSLALEWTGHAYVCLVIQESTVDLGVAAASWHLQGEAAVPLAGKRAWTDFDWNRADASSKELENDAIRSYHAKQVSEEAGKEAPTRRHIEKQAKHQAVLTRWQTGFLVPPCDVQPHHKVLPP